MSDHVTPSAENWTDVPDRRNPPSNPTIVAYPGPVVTAVGTPSHVADHTCWPSWNGPAPWAALVFELAGGASNPSSAHV